MDIKSLITKIEKATNYSYARDDYLYLNDKSKTLLNEIIYEWAAEQTTDVDLTRKVATLEAKVYTYEKIIANSNFAPILDRPTPAPPMDITAEEFTRMMKGCQIHREDRNIDLNGDVPYGYGGYENENTKMD
jgi:hypothetical protein